MKGNSVQISGLVVLMLLYVIADRMKNRAAHQPPRPFDEALSLGGGNWVATNNSNYLTTGQNAIFSKSALAPSSRSVIFIRTLLSQCFVLLNVFFVAPSFSKSSMYYWNPLLGNLKGRFFVLELR